MPAPTNAATVIAVLRGRSPWRYRVLAAAILAAMAIMTSGSAKPESKLQPPEVLSWRHTRDGWEQPRWTTARPRPCPAPLHPLCLTTLMILLSAMALVAHTPQPRAARARRQR